jgi:hypothetical protein
VEWENFQARRSGCRLVLIVLHDTRSLEIDLDEQKSAFGERKDCHQVGGWLIF